MSSTVHKRIDFVVASERAVRRNTQTVRKANDKFGLPLVTPRYIVDSITQGSPCDPAMYAPKPRQKRLPAALSDGGATSRVDTSRVDTSRADTTRADAQSADAQSARGERKAGEETKPGTGSRMLAVDLGESAEGGSMEGGSMEGGSSSEAEDCGTLPSMDAVDGIDLTAEAQGVLMALQLDAQEANAAKPTGKATSKRAARRRGARERGAVEAGTGTATGTATGTVSASTERAVAATERALTALSSLESGGPLTLHSEPTQRALAALSSLETGRRLGSRKAIGHRVAAPLYTLKHAHSGRWRCSTVRAFLFRPKPPRRRLKT